MVCVHSICRFTTTSVRALAFRRCSGRIKLELSARIYASKCVFEHSTREERNGAGENLACGSGARDEISLLQGSGRKIFFFFFFFFSFFFFFFFFFFSWLDEQFNWDVSFNFYSSFIDWTNSIPCYSAKPTVALVSSVRFFAMQSSSSLFLNNLFFLFF
jgi:hypothetical protein